MLEVRTAALHLLEQQATVGNIDLFYGDETGVSESGYVPYGWQFKDEEVCIKAIHGKRLNCFGLYTKDNRLLYKTTTANINADFVFNFLEELSEKIDKQTVIVLDNASVHTARKIKERLDYWQEKGLYIFYLPPYSPHLNIAERLWKELKGRWLKPQDYDTFDTLCSAVDKCLEQVGSKYKINFTKTNNDK